MNTTSKILAVIADRRNCSTEEIILTEKIGGDSLEKLDLLVAIEKEFAISISDEEIMKLNCYTDAINLINEKISVLN